MHADHPGPPARFVSNSFVWLSARQGRGGQNAEERAPFTASVAHFIKLSARRPSFVLEVQLFTNRRALPLGAEEWNALLAASPVNTVFQTYEWFDAWWSTFGAQHELFFLLVRTADGDAIGFAPLMIVRIRGRRELRLIGTGNADYLDFVASSHHAQVRHAILEYLQASEDRWDCAYFQNVPTHSPMVGSTPVLLRGQGLRAAVVGRVPCPALGLANADTTNAILNKYSLRRRERRLQKRGELTYRCVQDDGELLRLLPEFFGQHVERWKHTRSPSLFLDPRQRAFYAQLAVALSRRGWLAFSVLELDGRPIAFHFGFVYGTTLIWYKPSFSREHAADSPGLVLMKRMIEWATTRGVTLVDFTIGGEAFKSRYATHARTNVNIRLYKHRLAYVLGVLAHRTRRLMKEAWTAGSTSVRGVGSFAREPSQPRQGARLREDSWHRALPSRRRP